MLKIGYIDRTGLFETTNFTKYTDEELVRKDLLENNLTNYFVIPENYTATGTILIYSSRKNFADNFKTEEQIKTFLLANLLKNEPPEIIQRINRPINSEYYTLNENGLKNEDNGITILLLPIVFSLLFTLSIFTSQIAMWLVVSASLILINPVVLLLVVSQIHISITLLFYAMIYFVLSYLFFASIMAGVGAVATTSREGQQIAGIFSLAGVFPDKRDKRNFPKNLFTIALCSNEYKAVSI